MSRPVTMNKNVAAAAQSSPTTGQRSKVSEPEAESIK